MKIKQIEELTEMTRANIRFYESAGLLNPTRDENGYRDYSTEDLEILKRIKLLRLLELSLEDIKALQNDEQNLLEILEQHIQQLEKQHEALEKSKNICEQMHRDKVSYKTLNAQYYLDALKNEAPHEMSVLENDVIPMVYAPWRRYFARTLDVGFYYMIATLFLVLVLDWSFISQGKIMSTVSNVIQVALLLLVEPLLLTVFGTTLGKWILGLSVTHHYGRKLTYSEAFSRTFHVWTWGLGSLVPLANQYRLWKSYKQCKNKETLYWENSSILVLKDEDKDDFRIIPYIAVLLLLFLLPPLAMFQSTMPKCRGNITIQEFCNNFNRYSDFYGTDFDNIKTNGMWDENPETYYTSLLVPSKRETNARFYFEEENGILTKVTFSMEYIPALPDEDNHRFQLVSAYETEILFAIYSFVKAQDDYTLFFNDLDDMLKEVEKQNDRLYRGWNDFSFDVHGISVQFDVEKDGYNYLDDGLFVDDSLTTNPLKIHFTMTKN